MFFQDAAMRRDQLANLLVRRLFDSYVAIVHDLLTIHSSKPRWR